MPGDTRLTITDDEYSVLMIAAEGQWLAPIGRWAKPVRDLAMRGLMVRRDEMNYTITDSGRVAMLEREQADDVALGKALGNVARAAQVQAPISDFAEQAALLLADAGKASSRVTGDTPETAVRKWSEVILRRALEILCTSR